MFEVNFLSRADVIITLGNGVIAEMGSFEDCKNTEGYVRSLLTSVSDDKAGDEIQADEAADETAYKVPAEKKAKVVQEQKDKRRQLGDWSVYGYYFGSVGSVFVVIMLFLEVTWAFFSTFPTIWLKFWTDANAEAPGQRDAYYLGIYAALQVGGVFSFAVLIWFVLVPIAAKSGVNLHQRLLKAVMHEPISAPPVNSVSWTSKRKPQSSLRTLRAHALTNPSIRHSYTLIDRSQRPFYILLLTQQWLTLVLDLTTAALAVLVVGLAVRLRATVSVGLTGVSLVQLISFTETLKMLIQFWTALETSIGAVARIKNFSEETPDEVEDDALRRGLVSLPEGRERVSETDLNGWPDSGAIELRDVSASYDVPDQNDNDDQATKMKALDGISLSIRPGEKIGIRQVLSPPRPPAPPALSSGTILIDRLPLHSLPLLPLRSALIAITQDQFVLPGTVRQNLDPLGTVSADDAVVESALVRLGLWDAIRENGGLDTEFKEETLSHGQRQLFFLARAILRKDVGRVVLLDEATSRYVSVPPPLSKDSSVPNAKTSVDAHTERTVKDLIRKEFKDHTVIAIAHRLETVIDFDRVVVLDKGRVVEVGNPRISCYRRAEGLGISGTRASKAEATMLSPKGRTLAHLRKTVLSSDRGFNLFSFVAYVTICHLAYKVQPRIIYGIAIHIDEPAFPSSLRHNVFFNRLGHLGRLAITLGIRNRRVLAHVIPVPQFQCQDLAPRPRPVDFIAVDIGHERLEPRPAAREIEILEPVEALAQLPQQDDGLGPVIVEEYCSVLPSGETIVENLALGVNDGSGQYARLRCLSGEREEVLPRHAGPTALLVDARRDGEAELLREENIRQLPDGHGVAHRARQVEEVDVAVQGHERIDLDLVLLVLAVTLVLRRRRRGRDQDVAQVRGGRAALVPDANVLCQRGPDSAGQRVQVVLVIIALDLPVQGHPAQDNVHQAAFVRLVRPRQALDGLGAAQGGGRVCVLDMAGRSRQPAAWRGRARWYSPA
ncbi:ABC transporter ecdL [Colletotrichum spaethianum]|uniref:ABC transporter ecdL n=1 Tax=Colletotrichum spaethianum TaxID=700344 RepID=A0AA37LGP9_9PEZI|nr:ABC transporter ecdL [Colletotrichum spaethianum]GKT45640.1 ABC transporter ecdL [Colletotrichum spaethianum]